MHLPASLPLTKNYNKIQDKENVSENFSQLSGASSEPLSPLIRFNGSDKANVDPGGGGGCAAPGSTSALCLTPVQCTTFQKRYLEDDGGQGGSKGQVGRWGEEEEET